MDGDASMPLHLLHTRPDPRRLVAWAVRRNLLQAQDDLGYALHALLHAAFGAQAPQPFRYLDAEQGLLAYTRMDADEMRRHVAMADPEVVSALGLAATAGHDGCNLRPFPARWPAGHMLGFEVRIRPIIREARTGQERDAFLAVVEKAGADAVVERDEVYRAWLRSRLEEDAAVAAAEPGRQGAVDLLDARMTRFRLLGVMRRTQTGATGLAGAKREPRVSLGPDAVMAGRLRVRYPEAFAQLLARGVGRHRAFGFGMLLLRPADMA